MKEFVISEVKAETAVLVGLITKTQDEAKTKEYLDSNDAKYHLLYVDEFNGRDRSDLMDKVRSYNPRGSFPTIVLPGGKVVVGFREQLLREALFHDSAVIAESSQGNS